MTPEEKKRLSEQASDVKLKVSEYMYCVVMNRKVRVENPGFRQDLRYLSSIANSLNQIARAGNKYGFLSADDRRVLMEFVEEIYKSIKAEI